MKLMDIQGDSLGVPEQDYKYVVTLPASEFKRIIGDLKDMGEALGIRVSKRRHALRPHPLPRGGFLSS